MSERNENPQETNTQGEKGNLVLARKPGQKILIGDDIIVEVVEIDLFTKRVTMVIRAPKTTKIIRAEILGHQK